MFNRQDAHDSADRVAAMAHRRYGEYSSPHEVFGVLSEEMGEVEQAMHNNDWEGMRSECIDLAAVCLRFASEITIRESAKEL